MSEVNLNLISTYRSLDDKQKEEFLKYVKSEHSKESYDYLMELIELYELVEN